MIPTATRDTIRRVERRMQQAQQEFHRARNMFPGRNWAIAQRALDHQLARDAAYIARLQREQEAA